MNIQMRIVLMLTNYIHLNNLTCNCPEEGGTFVHKKKAFWRTNSLASQMNIEKNY